MDDARALTVVALDTFAPRPDRQDDRFTPVALPTSPGR
jgi:hypothetical protein